MVSLNDTQIPGVGEHYIFCLTLSANQPTGSKDHRLADMADVVFKKIPTGREQKLLPPSVNLCCWQTFAIVPPFYALRLFL